MPKRLFLVCVNPDAGFTQPPSKHTHLGALSTALRCERGEGEPEALADGEVPGTLRVGILVVVVGVGREAVQGPDQEGNNEHCAQDAEPHLRPQHLGLHKARFV